MRRRLVDASPLIYLARLGRLELLLLGVDEVLVPAVVLAEVRAKQDHSTEQVEQYLDSWLKICDRTQAGVLRFLPDLGAGEREVMSQALQEGIVSVVLDDLDARRVSRRLGLEPVGTLGFLLAAKKRSLLPSLEEEINRLRRYGFWVSETLVHQVLEEAGEVNG